MAFNPNTLPDTVRDAFKIGPLAWPLVVQEAIAEGMTDVDELADIVFFLHHPERNGMPLQASEQTLIDQWRSFRTLIRPVVDYTPKKQAPKKNRHIPVDLFALQHVVKIDGSSEFSWAFSKVWGDGHRWIGIVTVRDLVNLVKNYCGDEGYVRSLRLGGHGSDSSFRLGNVSVDASNIGSVTTQLRPIVPYFRPGHSIVRLDHCNVGNDRVLLKKVSKAFGGVAVIGPHTNQYTNEGAPAFEGKCTICGPNACVDVVTPNMSTRDLLEIIHMHIDPVREDNWSWRPN